MDGRFLRSDSYLTATASISNRAPLGRAATCTQERAGDVYKRQVHALLPHGAGGGVLHALDVLVDLLALDTRQVVAHAHVEHEAVGIAQTQLLGQQLAGKPALHVLVIGCLLYTSYSGGADYYNIKDLFNAGIWPITMATTVLKSGGYQRFSQIGSLLMDIDYGPWGGAVSYTHLGSPSVPPSCPPAALLPGQGWG